jgi:uncharacterized protein YdhG (YjbR/CyaY superfamily)
MATSNATTPEAYLAELPPDRREAIEAVRTAILEHLPEGFEEQVSFGMLAYVVPLERYPKTYNQQPLMLAALASQKQYMSVYLMGIYADPEDEGWFSEACKATGKRLDMGKSCVRFRRLDDLPVDLIGEAVARIGLDEYIELYEASRASAKAGK